jgi:hypothetical protein
MKIFRTFEIENRQAAWAAFLFAAFVLSFESYRFNVNYSEYFVYLYDTGDLFSALIAAGALLCSLLVFYAFRFLGIRRGAF